MIFYGTPHKGSPLANLTTNLFYITFPTIEVQELSSSNIQYLEELNKHFAKLVGKGLQSLSFAELKVKCCRLLGVLAVDFETGVNGGARQCLLV